MNKGCTVYLPVRQNATGAYVRQLEHPSGPTLQAKPCIGAHPQQVVVTTVGKRIDRILGAKTVHLHYIQTSLCLSQSQSRVKRGADK